MTARSLRPFGTTIFSEMTKLAVEHDAINLAQGFPDFEGPSAMVDAAVQALRSGHNQYSRSLGHPELVRAVAECQARLYGLEYDPETEVGVYSGATEGLASALLGLLDPDDEVVLFEPYYDSYPALVARCGATPRYCTLRFPDFKLPQEELEQLFNDRTRLVVLNSPHNPSGKVFSQEELEFIAALCRRYDVDVVSDEVYEHLTYDGVEHVPMATIEGMRERTLTISSSGKTFSFTGWKIGWATGPEHLISAAQAAHQFLTFCAATPLQIAVAHALRNQGPEYYGELRSSYQSRRDLLVGALDEAGFDTVTPSGTYFVLCGFSKLSELPDREFVETLVRRTGVVAIPPSVFYSQHPEEGQRLLRFAFCKELATLNEAAGRLASY